MRNGPGSLAAAGSAPSAAASRPASSAGVHSSDAKELGVPARPRETDQRGAGCDRQPALHGAELVDRLGHQEAQLVLQRRHLARGVLAPRLLRGLMGQRDQHQHGDQREGDPKGQPPAPRLRLGQRQQRQRHEQQDADRIAHPPREPVGEHFVGGQVAHGPARGRRRSSPTAGTTPGRSRSGRAPPGARCAARRPMPAAAGPRPADVSAWSVTPPPIAAGRPGRASTQ